MDGLMPLYDVYHQHTPVKVVGVEKDRSGDEIRLYAPAVYFRGQVEADSQSQALKAAKALSSRPMVKFNG